MAGEYMADMTPTGRKACCEKSKGLGRLLLTMFANSLVERTEHVREL
jgi:hypothetical protein